VGELLLVTVCGNPARQTPLPRCRLPMCAIPTLGWCPKRHGRSLPQKTIRGSAGLDYRILGMRKLANSVQADPTLSGAALPVADQSSQGPAVTPSGVEGLHCSRCALRTGGWEARAFTTTPSSRAPPWAGLIDWRKSCPSQGWWTSPAVCPHRPRRLVTGRARAAEQGLALPGRSADRRGDNPCDARGRVRPIREPSWRRLLLPRERGALRSDRSPQIGAASGAGCGTGEYGSLGSPVLESRWFLRSDTRDP
jgi:hypothetical protein